MLKVCGRPKGLIPCRDLILPQSRESAEVQAQPYSSGAHRPCSAKAITLMRHSENGRETFKKRYKEKAQFQKRKKSATITAKKNISPKSIDCLKSIMRRSIILKKNENEGFKKSLN
jgi:hypothetical protein